MRYFRELDIEFDEIKEAILKDYSEKTMGRFWNPIGQNHLDILQRMFKPLNITPVEYVLINANTKTYTIHTDMSIQSLRINIPILNCEHSSTHFFRVKDKKILNAQHYLRDTALEKEIYFYMDCSFEDKKEAFFRRVF